MTKSNAPALLAAVDLNARAEGVIRRAAKLAALSHARLVVLHVVEFHAGFESDHVPFQSPEKVRAAMARDARAWLVGLLCTLGLKDVEIVVRGGKLAEVVAEVAAERHARYIVTGQLKWGALGKLAGLAKDPRIEALGCDVLTVAGEGKQLGQVVSDLLGRWLPGEGKPLS